MTTAATSSKAAKAARRAVKQALSIQPPVAIHDAHVAAYAAIQPTMSDAMFDALAQERMDAEMGPDYSVPVVSVDVAKFASAKDAIRFLLTHNARLTLADLVRMSGKSEVNVRTMLSDLRTSKYCGKLGVFNTRAVREGGKVFYERMA